MTEPLVDKSLTSERFSRLAASHLEPNDGILVLNAFDYRLERLRCASVSKPSNWLPILMLLYAGRSQRFLKWISSMC